MNTTTAISSRRAKNRGVFQRMVRNFGAGLLRSLELMGAPYKDGALPPL
jgi:hypothetical protein